MLDEVKELDKDRWRELSRDVRELSHNPQPLRHEDSSTVLCSDWLVYFTGCEYCALIGWFISRAVSTVL